MATIAAPAIATARPARALVRLGAVACAGAVAAVLTAVGIVLDGLVAPDAWSVVRGAVVASYVAVGTYTSWRRPASRFGVMLAEVGLLFAVASLTASTDAAAHTLGRVVLAALVVYLAYAFLCFPRDSLGSPLERRLIAGFAVASAALWLVTLPLVEKLPVAGPLVDCGDVCPDNALRVVSTPESLSSGIDFAVNAVTAVALLGVIAVVVAKVRAPARLRRRLMLPVLASVIALAGVYAAFTVIREAGVGDADALRVLGAVTAFGVPLGMLVGQARGRLFAVTSLVELVARVGRRPVSPARVETLLRESLGDPLLRLALHRSGHEYVDVEGDPIELPTGRPEVGVTPVLRNGRPVAALIHDAALDEGSGTAEGLAATALMLLENAQLVEELRASRARIVESGQNERLRLERNLHDGAQQRLFTIQLKLSDARARARDPRLARALDELTADAAGAVDDLRDLARGLYPTVLRERGLADGLRSVARTAAVSVRVVGADIGRCPPPVEEAVYFTVLEAIQNAAKHGGGPGVRVTVAFGLAGGDVHFSVTDDGVGFDPGSDGDGIGLMSMRDRVGAVGGTLEVSSRAGHGTIVEGVVPSG